jgi:hypothetical protein
MAGKIEIYRIEYDRLRDPNHYTAHIGAQSQQDAVNHVTSRVGNQPNITGISKLCELDEFTRAIIEKLKSQMKQITPELNSSVEDVILAEQRNLDQKVKGKIRK